MKTTILTLLLLMSFRSFATEYCYDEAVFAVAKLRNSIELCDESLPTKPLDKLIRKLRRVRPGYSLKIRNAMSKLYGYMHTDLGYEYAQTDEVKRCIQKLEYNKFDKVKVQVMDAMVLCGI